MTLLWFILIGIASGLLVGGLTRGNGFGLVGNVLAGIFGATSGGYLLSMFNLDVYGTLGDSLMALAGSVAALSLMTLFSSRTNDVVGR